MDKYSQNIQNVQSRKSVFDIPHLAWRTVLNNVYHSEDILLRMCNASQIFDDIITADKGYSKQSLLGEKVFGILVEKLYLGKEDLQTCSRTTDELGYFASSAWDSFEKALQQSNSEITTFQCFTKPLELEKLIQELSWKSENDTWESLIGKRWKFGCACWFEHFEDNEMQEKFHTEFGEKLKILTEKWGNYLEVAPRLDYRRKFKLPMSPQCIHELPEFGPCIKIKMHRRTREKLLQWDEDNANYPDHFQIWEFVKERIHAFYIDFGERKIDRILKEENDGFPLRSLKEISIKAENVEHQNNLMTSGIENLGPIEKIALSVPCFSTVCFDFFAKFQCLTEIILVQKGDMPEGDFLQENAPLNRNIFPGVDTLTIIPGKSGIPIDYLVECLPSLRNLRFYSCEYKQDFKDLLLKSVGETVGVDLFKVYAGGGKIEESNIWKKFAKLRLMSIVSKDSTEAQENTKNAPPTRLVERYRRDCAGIVRCESSVIKSTTFCFDEEIW